jgi:hypothetical protein
MDDRVVSRTRLDWWPLETRYGAPSPYLDGRLTNDGTVLS